MERALVGGGIALGSIIAAPYALAAAGFTGTGVVAGSLAAGWQATVGNVAAGGLFAGLQSVSMGGFTSATYAAFTAGGAAVSQLWS